MEEHNFGEHFGSTGILDGTGPTENNSIGLLSPNPDNNYEQAARLPQSSVESAIMPVYETLDDPQLNLTPITARVTVFPEPLLDPAESELLRTRWNKIQARFVDEPLSSVELADVLVTDLIARITSIFTENHTSLQTEWGQGNDISTENLRVVLQHYRSFFNRLVD